MPLGAFSPGLKGGLALLFGRSKKKSADTLSSKSADAPSGDSVETALASQLKELCGGDGELYTAMSHLVFLDPKKIQTSTENFLNEARDFETKGNALRAEVAYRMVAGLSLYKGDIDGVRTYFSKAASISGDKRPEYKVLAKRADEAVSIARKFYEASESAGKI